MSIATAHRTRIKFCGLTRSEDIASAVRLGVDAIGLIFVASSRRCLSFDQGRALRAGLPPLVSSVALVMDAPLAELRTLLAIVRPNLLQFHGGESESDCRAAALPYLKAIAMGDRAVNPLDAIAGYPSASGFVLDAHASGAGGGSGQRFDWSRWPRSMDRPLLLAGGLDPDNVYDAVRRTRPFAVDVSSGIESAPGVKCPERMARFVAAVRCADHDIAADTADE